MSRLDDMAALDLGRLLEDGSDLGSDAEYRAAESGAWMPFRIVFGDPTDGLQSVAEGMANNRTATGTARLSFLVDAIGRLPQSGDTVRVKEGAMAGEWSVTGVQLDQFDGANLALRCETMFTAGRAVRS